MINPGIILRFLCFIAFVTGLAAQYTSQQISGFVYVIANI